jgi:hypothetical protein
MRGEVYVVYAVLLADFNQNWIILTNIRWSAKQAYRIEYPFSESRVVTRGQTDRRG